VLEFWKENLVLLAVPKTGTTAIEKSLSPFADISILNPPGLEHTPVAKFNRFVQPYLESVGSNAMETAGVIRNPLAWLGSWYRYGRVLFWMENRTRPKTSVLTTLY